VYRRYFAVPTGFGGGHPIARNEAMLTVITTLLLLVAIWALMVLLVPTKHV
jgi:hypothetical protein